MDISETLITCNMSNSTHNHKENAKENIECTKSIQLTELSIIVKSNYTGTADMTTPRYYRSTPWETTRNYLKS